MGEHVPGEGRELAGDRDRSDVLAAARGDALPERAQRTGAAGRDPGGLDQDVTRGGRAFLACASVTCRGAAQLADLWVKP